MVWIVLVYEQIKTVVVLGGVPAAPAGVVVVVVVVLALALGTLSVTRHLPFGLVLLYFVFLISSVQFHYLVSSGRSWG